MSLNGNTTEDSAVELPILSAASDMRNNTSGLTRRTNVVVGSEESDLDKLESMVPSSPSRGSVPKSKFRDAIISISNMGPNIFVCATIATCYGTLRAGQALHEVGSVLHFFYFWFSIIILVLTINGLMAASKV
jgi:hypothetical protein